MPWDILFMLVNALVIPAWLLLLLGPGWRTTQLVVHSGIYPLAYGALYTVCMIAALFFGQSAGAADMSSIAGIAALFDHPNGVVIGWTHYLVFDLFVGAWIGRDAGRCNVPHMAVVPCLFATFMFGPVGLMAYILVRLARGQGFSLYETPDHPAVRDTPVRPD